MVKKINFNNELTNKKCEGCVFYTGDDFYGSCSLIIKLAKKKLYGYSKFHNAIKNNKSNCDFCDLTFNNFIDMVSEAIYDEKDF